MFIYRILSVALFVFSFSDISSCCASPRITSDTIRDNQVLYNGRIWISRYARVKEDQFLFSNDFLTGSVYIDGDKFENIKLKYDVYNDEIITPDNNRLLIQLNKEMIDSFDIRFQDKTWKFTHFTEDSIKVFSGYVNVLYSGKSTLYVKYKKYIELLAVEKKYDRFFLKQKIFIKKDNNIHQVNGRRELVKLFSDHKKEIRNFSKANRLNLTRENPESFIPLIKFYDSLGQKDLL